MRTTVAALSLVLLAGCGSSDSPPSEVFGGFTPQDGTAVIFAPAVCNIPFVGTTAVAGVGVGFTDYAGACDVLSRTQLCGTRESSATVIGVALSGQVGGGAIGPAGPGTYPFLANPPTGAFLASAGDAAEVGVACGVVTELDMSGGRIVLTAVSDTAVAGSLDLRFDDGSVFQHSFDVAVCPLTLDICDLFGPCFDPVCDPAP
jgi:hypothetical protein